MDVERQYGHDSRRAAQALCTKLLQHGSFFMPSSIVVFWHMQQNSRGMSP